MSSLSSALRALQAAQYLAPLENAANTLVELLPNGKRYCEQLSLQWRQATNHDDGVQPHFNEEHHSSTPPGSNDSRLSFIRTPQFVKNVRLVQTQRPAIIKMLQAKLPTNGAAATKSDLFQLSSTTPGTHLITDYLIPATRGLEKFYNIQRERKIWWMRYSANPSRYFVEPFELPASKEETDLSGCQSITIKSRFAFGTAAVEHVTLVPLKQTTQAVLELGGPPTAVIRSCIDLEHATCALLFDGCDHNRGADTLLLNRLLVPYQCAVGYVQDEGSALEDLRDLCSHLSFVLRRAGLRLFEQPITLTHSNERLNSELRSVDCVGVPYTLLVEAQSLSTGLLKLRSRDTTLAETIHISDIPGYLLHIFGC